MKIVIAGSRKLPEGAGTRLMRETIGALTKEDIVFLRSPMNRALGTFEQEVYEMIYARHKGYGPTVELRKPRPTDRHPGRASVYLRDYEMVEDADRVLLFFTPEDAATGYSGTAHLLDKALDAGVPVNAYAVYDNGSVVRIGEIEPE